MHPSQLASIKTPATAHERIKSNGLPSTPMTRVLLPLLSEETHPPVSPLAFLVDPSPLIPKMSQTYTKTSSLAPPLSLSPSISGASWPQLSSLMTLKSECPSQQLDVVIRVSESRIKFMVIPAFLKVRLTPHLPHSQYSGDP